jgi:hypothetical protein
VLVAWWHMLGQGLPTPWWPPCGQCAALQVPGPGTVRQHKHCISSDSIMWNECLSVKVFQIFWSFWSYWCSLKAACQWFRLDTIKSLGVIRPMWAG